MAVTLGAILEKARRSLLGATGRRVDDAEIIDDINEAVREILGRVAAKPEYYMRTGETQLHTANIVGGTPNYDLPTDFFLPVLLKLTNSDGNTTDAELLTFERTLDSDAKGYFLLNDDIYVYPEPDADVTSGLNLYYIAQHADITTLASNLPLADDFQDAYAAWAVVKGKARQEKRTADFGAVYAKVERQLDFVIANVNKPVEQGLHVLWRPWI